MLTCGAVDPDGIRMAFEFPAGPTATGVLLWDKRAVLYGRLRTVAPGWRGERTVKSRCGVSVERVRGGMGQGSPGARRERRTRACVWRRFTAGRGGCVADRANGSCEPGSVW